MPWCDSFEDGFALAAEGDRPRFSLLLASKESTVGGESDAALPIRAGWEPS
jgi:hypothetical protein